VTLVDLVLSHTVYISLRKFKFEDGKREPFLERQGDSY
jgi:hypothetical protein